MAATNPSEANSFIPFRHRLRRHLLRLPHVLVWSAALIGALVLYGRQEQGLVLTGFAGEVRYHVAPEVTSRLERLEVSLGQEVTPGQVVAFLDDAELLLDLQEARAELERLSLEIGREKALWELQAAGQRVDQQTNLRRFARDVDNAHIEYLDALASLAEDRIRLQGLEITLERTQLLHDSEVTPTAILEESRIACEALRERITRQEPLVREMKARYEEAAERYRWFRAEHPADIPDGDLLLKPLQYAVKVQEVRIEKVNLTLVELALRAPAAGQVAEIFRRPGEVVLGGQPVVSILESRASEIVVYLPENRILDVQPDQQVRIRRQADPGRVFQARVAHLGGCLEQLPLRLAPRAVAPTWGLAVHIPLPPLLAAKPGEAFEVRF